MNDEPVKVWNWPFGYCDNGFGHEGEHPLYLSSDGGCRNFMESSRLLEIKQLFDLVAENESLRAELAALREPESVVSPDCELREAIEEVLSRGHTAAYDLRNDIHAVLSSPTSVGGDT